MAVTKTLADTTVAGKENSDEQVIFLQQYNMHIIINIVNNHTGVMIYFF